MAEKSPGTSKCCDVLRIVFVLNGVNNTVHILADAVCLTIACLFCHSKNMAFPCEGN